MVPAVVTAGGRLEGPLAQATGQSIKALVTLHERPLIRQVLDALQGSGVVGETVVVGPDALAATIGETRLLPEATTGVENLVRGLESVDAGAGFVLFAASDLPFLCAESVRWLVENAPRDADIVFPITGRTRYEARFPQTPGTWARLQEGELTGGSVFLLRPSAIQRNRHLIEQVFAARKSQWAMATLLGFRTALRFALGKLPVSLAEKRASELTGCRCRVLPDAPPHLACDLDTYEEWLYLKGLPRP